MQGYKLLFVVFGLSTVAASAAYGRAEFCRVGHVEEASNPWEEGLGVYHSPSTDSDAGDVEVEVSGGKVVSIEVGQGAWRAASGDTLTQRKIVGGSGVKYEVHEKGSKLQVQVVIYSSGLGLVLLKERALGAWKEVAKLDCGPTDVVEGASAGDANVRFASPAYLKRLHKEAALNIDEQDFGYLLGDADISVKKITHYRVFKAARGRELAGFLVDVKFRNSENDRDEVGTFRFDRYGCLLGDADIH